MNTVIFDLDGTLLPMVQENFLDMYFKSLAMKMTPYGLDAKKLIQAVWAGTKSMIENDGTMSNEERFWSTFTGIQGEEMRRLEPVFEEFYQNEFHNARSATSTNPLALQCVKLLKDKGYTLVLATNPVFPRIATLNRIKWAGLCEEDFEWITTYENSSYCKPNLKYYQEILEQIGKNPEECIMIGNDVREDMCVANIGMDTYLLSDCLINSEDVDLKDYRQGCFADLLEYIKKLPELVTNM